MQRYRKGGLDIREKQGTQEKKRKQKKKEKVEQALKEYERQTGLVFKNIEQKECHEASERMKQLQEGFLRGKQKQDTENDTRCEGNRGVKEAKDKIKSMTEQH